MPFLCIEFVPGNHAKNPESQYFVIIIYVGDDGTRSPARISARLLSANSWDQSNKSLLGFRHAGSIPCQDDTTSRLAGESTDRISLVGYDISLPLQLIAESGFTSYHHVYIDWQEIKLPGVGCHSLGVLAQVCITVASKIS